MKVTKKVGRRKHSRHSSVSRRRLRNNKNSKNKSSYKKRYGKTYKGGYWSGAKKGGARSRKYSHKRGKRFHRGGLGNFPPQDIQPGSSLEPTIYQKSVSLEPSGRELPTGMTSSDFIGSYDFEFVRTDGFFNSKDPVKKKFDVYGDVFANLNLKGIRGLLLFRHDDKDASKFDKKISISNAGFSSANLPLTGEAVNPYNESDKQGVYTFPQSDTNQQSFKEIYKCLLSKSRNFDEDTYANHTNPWEKNI